MYVVMEFNVTTGIFHPFATIVFMYVYVWTYA